MRPLRAWWGLDSAIWNPIGDIPSGAVFQAERARVHRHGFQTQSAFSRRPLEPLGRQLSGSEDGSPQAKSGAR